MGPIRVIHHHAAGDGWWAESPDVAGWSASAESFEALRRLAEDGVRFALDRDDVEIQHFAEVESSAAA